MDDNTNPLRTTPSLPPRSGEVVKFVRQVLEWASDGIDPDGEDIQRLGVETGLLLKVTYDPDKHDLPEWLKGDVEPGDDYFEFSPALRSALADPIPEAPADEEVEGVAVDCVRELRKHLRDSPVANIWLDTISAALRRSQAAALVAANERIAELEAGLEPFAEAAVLIPPEEQDFKVIAHVPAGPHAKAFKAMSDKLTAGNFRRARRLTHQEKNNGR